MVDCGTARIVTTGTCTGLRALLLYAGLVARALGVEDTLGPTVGSGPNVTRLTGAGLVAVHFSADGVGSTRVGHTGDMRGWGWRLDGILVAVEERVTAVALWTAADGVMINHLALCIGPTCPRAGVSTLLLDAGLAEATF